VGDGVLTEKAVGWFSSAQRWFQTKRSIESYREHHPYDDHTFYLLFCGTAEELQDIDVPSYVNIVMPHEVHPYYHGHAARIGVTGGFMRPLIVEYMLRMDHDHVMAFDGDTEFYGSLDDLWQILESHHAIATPHRLYAPPRDGKVMCLEQFAMCGNYNVGLTAFTSTRATMNFVDWWMRESIDNPECEMGRGRFAEQGWYRFVGDFMDRVYICRDQGVNYAFWRYDTPADVIYNESRDRYEVRDEQRGDFVPLRMFHYGALDFNDLRRVAVHHSRCEAGPGLMHLFEGYRNRVLPSK
jgi:hypothetical protein